VVVVVVVVVAAVAAVAIAGSSASYVKQPVSLAGDRPFFCARARYSAAMSVPRSGKRGP
jgi:hypothetical protein